MEDETVDPLVVEDQVRRPGLLEIGHPAVGIHLVAEPFLPLVDRIRFERLIDVAGHHAQHGRAIPRIFLRGKCVGYEHDTQCD